MELITYITLVRMDASGAYKGLVYNYTTRELERGVKPFHAMRATDSVWIVPGTAPA